MDPKLQRRHERITVSIPAQFGILVPEATFQPMMYDATVSDLSERGAMIEIDLERDVYVALLQKTRYCRIAVPSGLGLPGRIIGKAVWIEPVGRGGEKSFRLGLFFEEISPEDAEQIRSFVERAANARTNA